MKRLIGFLSLFSSAGTLLCCALPALFVTLGAGATFAGLVTNVPQLIWLSEHKSWLFVFGAIMLSTAYFLRWRAKNAPCPTDPKLAENCKQTRDWSKWILHFSAGMYLVGFSFAFVLPYFI